MKLNKQLQEFAEIYLNRSLTDEEKEKLIPFNKIPVPNYNENAAIGKPVEPVGTLELMRVVEAMKTIKSL